MSLVRIASIHFAPVSAKRNFRSEAYQIQAVARDADPGVLIVRDLIQREWGSMLPGTNKRQEHSYLVLGEHIGADIVGEWTGTNVVGMGMNPLRHPGIWLVRDRLPVTEQLQRVINQENVTYEERMVTDSTDKQVFREATVNEQRDMWDEDLEAALAADRAYAEWCWADGNRISDNGKHNQLIPPNYKLAAKRYGLDAEWLKEASGSDSKPCPHCEKLIAKTAMICKWCTQPVDLRRWARWTAEKDRAMAEAMQQPPVPAAVAQPLRGITNKPQPQV